MKKEFLEYLDNICVSTVLKEQIGAIYEFYNEIIPDRILDIILTDYVNEDGSREFESLWFFSENFIMEAKQFAKKGDFDMTPIKNRINYWNIKTQDYDLKNATEKSRIYLRFVLDTSVDGNLKASNRNCNYLMRIFRKYVVPNLKE